MQWSWISFLDYFYRSSPNVLIHSEPPPILRKKITIIIWEIWAEIHQSRTWGRRFHISNLNILTSENSKNCKVIFMKFAAQKLFEKSTPKPGKHSYKQPNLCKFLFWKCCHHLVQVKARHTGVNFINAKSQSSGCIIYNFKKLL